MPAIVANLIQGAVIFLVTQGLKALGRLIGVDLSGYAALITAVLVAAVLAASEAIYAALPPDWQAVVVQGAEFMAALLAAMGVHYTVTQSLPNAFARYFANG